MYNWEETLGQTQDLLEGLHSPSSLRMPQDPPGDAGMRCWGEGYLERPTKPVATMTQPHLGFYSIKLCNTDTQWS